MPRLLRRHHRAKTDAYGEKVAASRHEHKANWAAEKAPDGLMH